MRGCGGEGEGASVFSRWALLMHLPVAATNIFRASEVSPSNHTQTLNDPPESVFPFALQVMRKCGLMTRPQGFKDSFPSFQRSDFYDLHSVRILSLFPLDVDKLFRPIRLLNKRTSEFDGQFSTNIIYFSRE